MQRLLVVVLQFQGQIHTFEILKANTCTYTIVRLVIVGRMFLLLVIVAVTVVGLTTVMELVLITLLVGSTTASQKAIAKGFRTMISAMTFTPIHSTVSMIPGTNN